MSDNYSNYLAFAVAVGTIWIVVRLIQKALRRKRLIDKYGPEDARRILAQLVWQGMTSEQLIESWGTPADIDRTVYRTKTKATWKYGEAGKNRFKNRVFLEKDVVVGWKEQ